MPAQKLPYEHKSLTFRVDVNTYSRLQKLAKENGRSAGEEVRRILDASSVGNGGK